MSLKSWQAREHILMALIMASVAVNVGLTIQNSRLRASAEPKPFSSGDTASPLRLHRSDGSSDVLLTYGRESLPTLLYWFQPSCGWCEANLSNFKALGAQASGKYRFIAISPASPGELTEYSRGRGVNFPMYTVDVESARRYRLRGTPVSLLVSASGGLMKRWEGAYTPRVLLDIEKTLAVALPGLPVSDGSQ
jgi:hypothetical protein